jgi:hypothetical protein
MQGVYYLLSIVAVFVVFNWYIRNEGVAEGQPTRGLLAMKDSSSPAPKRERKKRWQHKPTQSP